MNEKRPVSIAMWSGPRNLSTAMMRSFGARADTVCIDEPFYAAYLKLTGLDHPMREDILRDQETDPARVAGQLCDGSHGADVVYQKHMTHHMIEGVPRDWMEQVRHAFLIRHPARVLASYAQKMETASLDAIGFPQQLELYEAACHQSGQGESGQGPIVIDSDYILEAAEAALPKLCAGLGIGYDAAMLGWQAGPKPEDGVWAAHWYDGVNASTGFGAAPGPLPVLPPDMARICAEALPIYEYLLSKSLHGGKV